MPPCASGPVFTVSRPSLNGAACAIAGAGNLNAATAVPAAVPAINLRRVTLRDMHSSLVAPGGAYILMGRDIPAVFDATLFRDRLPHHGDPGHSHHRPSHSSM